jgi:hypothetical protein
MPYTMEDFRRDFTREHLKDLSPEDIRSALSPEQIRALLPPEERVAGLSLEQRLAGVSPEELAELRKRLKSTEPPAG